MENWMRQGLTVSMLLEKLASVRRNAALIAEGCDCLGPGARLWASSDGAQVCLLRPAGDGVEESAFAGWREL